METPHFKRIGLLACPDESVMAIFEWQPIEKLGEFETGWDQLLSKSQDNHPFLTYEWMTSWWKHFGQGKELKLFTARSEGAISLAIPVMYSTRRILGVKHGKAEFVAAPDSDYQVFLVTSFQEASTTIDELIETMMEDSSETDYVVFDDVPEDSLTCKLLEKVNETGQGRTRSITSSCPYIPLPKDFDAFLQSLGSNMRRNLKVWERDAAKEYKIEFIKYDKIGTAQETMKTLFELHQKRQTAKGNWGVFSDDLQKSFHVDVANAFAEKGWLALFFLTFNDKPVATIYAYEYNKKLYAYLCGFDPEYAKYRPGHLAFKKLIQYGIERELKELDFLRGDEEYKNRWGALVRNNFEYRIPKKGLKSTFCNMVFEKHQKP